MSRITALPVLADADVDGSEQVPVVKGGQTKRVNSAGLLSPYLAVIEGARDAALAALNPQTDEAAGLAATPDGGLFSYYDAIAGEVKLVRNNGGVAEELAIYFGASHVGTAAGGAVQSHLDGLGWFSPDAKTAQLARAFQVNRQTIAADGVTDDTDALVAMEDEAESFAADGDGSTIRAPHVVFGPELYSLGVLAKKSYAWRGQGPDNTKLLFNGAAAEDFITQDIVTGRNSAAMLADMSIDGADCGSILKVPANLAGYGADDRYEIERVRFFRGSRQIDLGAGYVNCHVRSLRFDNYNDSALYIAPYASQNQANFHLSDFTADNASGGYATATATCFARVDMSAYSTSANMGNLVFSNARIEFNGHALAGNKGAFEILTAAGSAGRQVAITLREIDLQNTFAGGVVAPFYRSAAGNTHAERYFLQSVTMGGVGNFIFAGDYPTWMKSIPTGNWHLLMGDDINGFIGLRTVSSGATGLEFMAPASNTVIRQVLVPGEAFARLQERADVLLTGNGTVAPGVMFRWAGKTGWGLPTGTLNRTTFSAGISTGAAAAYSQADTNALLARVAGAEQRLAALVSDIHQSGSGSHGLIRA